jgi:hypothetical protein
MRRLAHRLTTWEPKSSDDSDFAVLLHEDVSACKLPEGAVRLSLLSFPAGATLLFLLEPKQPIFDNYQVLERQHRGQNHCKQGLTENLALFKRA